MFEVMPSVNLPFPMVLRVGKLARAVDDVCQSVSRNAPCWELGEGCGVRAETDGEARMPLAGDSSPKSDYFFLFLFRFLNTHSKPSWKI